MSLKRSLLMLDPSARRSRRSAGSLQAHRGREGVAAAGLQRPGKVFGQFQYLTPPVAVYPEETIKSHLAFLARRRALRPSEEYRTPSDEEWQEFLGHFERRKVATGLCGRAFSTPCIHENACLRCSMHWPDPAQRPRLAEIRGNLLDRIAEAGREGWLGEVEGLQITLAGAESKLAQIDRRTSQNAVDLGIPAPRQANA